METVDIQAVESKLSDVTVTAIPINPKPAQSSTSSSTSTPSSVTSTNNNNNNNTNNNNNNNNNTNNNSSNNTQPSQSKYAQLLGVIEELGREVRPTYAGSRSSAERLKRGIVNARILVRECLIETERSARQ